MDATDGVPDQKRAIHTLVFTCAGRILRTPYKKEKKLKISWERWLERFFLVTRVGLCIQYLWSGISSSAFTSALDTIKTRTASSLPREAAPARDMCRF